MKIIKKGTKTPPDKRIYITKCNTCGCKFTYMEKDFAYLGIEATNVVECPQCNYYVPVPLIKRKYKGDISK